MNKNSLLSTKSKIVKLLLGATVLLGVFSFSGITIENRTPKSTSISELLITSATATRKTVAFSFNTSSTKSEIVQSNPVHLSIFHFERLTSIRMIQNRKLMGSFSKQIAIVYWSYHTNRRANSLPPTLT